MARAETVAFDSQGVRCEADLYQPSSGDPPWPVVVMAHGFGAERAWGLSPYAERFAETGVAAFVFDHRYHGGSGGKPRRLIDPRRQLEDWAAAIGHAASMERIDADRVALWGTSFSGGHVLATARREPRVRAVVAQVPFVDGAVTFAHQALSKGPIGSLRTTGHALADQAAALAGREPVEVPIVSRPGEGGLLDTPGAMEGYEALVPEGQTWVNRTPARVVLTLPLYRPGRRAEGIEAPIHITLAGEDSLLPVEATEDLAERLEDAQLERIPAGHFDVYQEPWVEQVTDAQAGFLSQRLRPDG